MRIADISEPMWNLLFTVRLSIRYHDRRKRFFAGLHRVTAAASVVFGSAAVAAFAGELSDKAGMLSAAAVSIVAGLDLVIGFAPASTLHNDLRRRFIDLEKAIIESHDDSALGEYQRRKLDIEKDEPALRTVLSQLCYNDIVRAEYSPTDVSSHLIRVPWWRRLTAHLG